MLVSQEIGAVYTLKDEVSPVLKAMADRAEAFGKLLGDIQKKLLGINDVSLRGFSEQITGITEKLTAFGEKTNGVSAEIRRSLEGVDAAFTQTGRKVSGFSRRISGIGKASEKAAEGLIGNLGKADAALDTTTKAANALKDALAGAGAASRDIPRLPRGGGGGGNHPRPGQSGGHAERGNTWGREGAGVDAGVLGFVGYEAVKGSVEEILKRGIELGHVQQQMLQGGMTQAEVGQATSGAWIEARKYGLDVSKVAEDIKELRLPFGSTEHALAFVDPLERMRVVLNAVQSGNGNSSADAVYKMARAGELKGLQNPEDFVSYFDGMTKAISASGGKITPNDFAQVTKYGKLASFGLSEDFYTRSLPTMVQTMGATTAGQSMQSLFSTLSGSISQRSFYKIQDLGLIADPSKIVQTKTGIQLNPGAIAGYDEFVKNPLVWAKDYLGPLLEKKFGDISNPENKEKVLGALQGMFGNRNSAAAVAELALRAKSFDKDAGLINDAKGLGGADYLLEHDPTTVMKNFSAAWENLLTALGDPAVKPATNAIISLTGGLNKIGEWAQNNPGFAKSFTGAMFGLATGLGALGLIGVAALAPGGLVVAGLVALGGAIAGFLAINWSDVKAKVTPAVDAVNNLMISVRDKIVGAITGLGNVIGDAFSSMIDGVLGKLRKIPGVGHLFDAGPGDFKVPSGYNREAHARAWLSDKAAKDYTDGLMPGAGFLWHSAYRTGDTFGGAANDNGMVDTLALGVCKGLLMYASGGGAAVASGSGGGLINASYEGGDAGGSGGAGFFGHTSAQPNLRYGRGGDGHYRHAPGSGSVPDIGPHVALGTMGHKFAEKAPVIMDGLMKKYGLTREQAAGVLGNLGHESAGFTAYHEGGQAPGSGGVGWAQWTGSRRRAFESWTNAHGLNPTSDEASWRYLTEGDPETARAIAAVRQQSTVEGSLRAFHDSFERSADINHGVIVKPGSWRSREAYASRAFGMQPHGAVAATPRNVPVAGAPPSRTVTPGRPASKQAAPMIQARIEVPVHIGGDKIAHHVVHQMVEAMAHPTAVGGPDTYGSHQGPWTPLVDAA